MKFKHVNFLNVIQNYYRSGLMVVDLNFLRSTFVASNFLRQINVFFRKMYYKKKHLEE